MPKIDWRDDDQPRWEPRYRVARPRRVWSGAYRADPATQLYVPSLTDLLPPTAPETQRRPLHQIWGEPVPREPAS